MTGGRSDETSGHLVEVEWLDIERPDGSPPRGGQASPEWPRWQVVVAMGLAMLALIGAYGLGRAGDPAPQVALPAATATPVPTSTPVPTATSAPTPTPPELVDLLGQGEVLDELELSDGTRAVIWCRETVPGTRIASTLALLHVEPTDRFGDQLVGYDELTRPWVPTGASWRGGIDVEGFGADAGTLVAPDGSELEGLPGDGTRCESCAASRITLATAGTVLYGDCVHGEPFRAGIAYIIASPRQPGQTPLAVHASCGITTIERRGNRFFIEAEVPLVQGLTDARFRFPAVEITHRDDRFWADDLVLFDWACDLERSTQLGDQHLLPTAIEPGVTFDVVDSAIGPIGVHGPLVVGLEQAQCSRLTRAWWGISTAEREAGQPIADLLGFDPPPDERDWYYTCQAT